MSNKSDLHYYWEAFHYKSNVGELILKKIFMFNSETFPLDFGYEIRYGTILDVLHVLREDQKKYLMFRSEEIDFFNIKSN